MSQGFSAIVPARFAIPENPLGVGKFVPASYSIPENPLLRALMPKPTNVVAANLTGCGSTIPGDRRDCSGLGVIDSTGVVDRTFRWVGNNWLFVAVGAVVAYVFWKRSKDKKQTGDAPAVKSNPRRYVRRKKNRRVRGRRG